MNLKRKLRSVYRRVKRVLRAGMGRDVLIPISHVAAHVRHGSDYGGWHVLPQYIDTDSVVYCFGIGKDISFDCEMVQTYGVTVDAFDFTPESLAWLRHQALPKQLKLHQYGVSDQDGTVKLYPPQREGYVSHTIIPEVAREAKSIEVPVKRLSTIMGELRHARIDLLKIDIEGAEYAVLRDLVASRIPVGQLLVEFHHGMHGIEASDTKRSIEMLLDGKFHVFFVSETGYEYSFVHEDVLRAPSRD